MASFTSNSFKTIISLITLLSLLHIHHTTAVKGGYWSEEDAITAPNIDSTLFTHLFCAFANLNTQTYQITVHPECSTFPNIIKQKNPSVKALLCIGGGKAKSSDYNTMASQPSTRKTFIDSAINQALAYGYDGLDLDWEQQTTVEEMNNYGILLNEWRAAIKARSLPLLLTAAVHYIPDANSVARFPIQAITQNLDFINVMAYDFYGPRYAPKPLVTRPHAPLRNPQSPVSGSNGISKWISAGVPAKMLVLGIPFYGYAWKLENGDNNGILAPSIGGDTYFGEDGTPTYKQIRDFISEKGAIVKYNSSYVTNYCYFGTTWIVYDDLEAISGKVGYVKSTGLLGYFAWNIVQDSNWALSKQASQTWGA